MDAIEAGDIDIEYVPNTLSEQTHWNVFKSYSIFFDYENYKIMSYSQGEIYECQFYNCVIKLPMEIVQHKLDKKILSIGDKVPLIKIPLIMIFNFGDDMNQYVNNDAHLDMV